MEGLHQRGQAGLYQGPFKIVLKWHLYVKLIVHNSGFCPIAEYRMIDET